MPLELLLLLEDDGLRVRVAVLLLAGGEQGRGQLLKVAQPLQRLLGVLDELCVLLEVPDRLLPPDDVLPPEEGVRLIKAL